MSNSYLVELKLHTTEEQEKQELYNNILDAVGAIKRYGLELKNFDIFPIALPFEETVTSFVADDQITAMNRALRELQEEGEGGNLLVHDSEDTKEPKVFYEIPPDLSAKISLYCNDPFEETFVDKLRKLVSDVEKSSDKR